MLTNSIIVPVYNCEQYLRACIDSILQQEYKSYELILVDDGSTDHSGYICDDYASKFPMVRVYHIVNGGASRARNIGIEHACGQWLSFVDADDWVAPCYLETFANLTDKSDITFFPATQFFHDGNTKICKHKALKVNTREDVERSLCSLKYGNLGDIFGWTWDKFFKASIIKENNIRFVEGLVFREDEIFTMDYCRYISSLQILDIPLYYYRITSTGLTANGIRKTDYLQLADHLMKNQPYYSNEKLLSKDKQRIVDYYQEYAAVNSTFLRLPKAYRPLYDFVNAEPEIAKYASNQQLIKRMFHSYWYTCSLLFLDWLIESIQSRIK